MLDAELTLLTETSGGLTVVHVSGDLDCSRTVVGATAPTLRRMLDAELTLLTEASEGLTVVHVSGDLDLSTVPAFEAELEPSLSAKLLVVDLAGCTFIDSSALRALVQAQRQVEEAGGKLGLVAPVAQPARRVLEVATLSRSIPVWETVDAAVNSDA